jgi:hypothetical protein
VSLSQENGLIGHSLRFWRQVALKRNHFGVLAKVLCSLHGGIEVPVATDDDRRVVEITESANNNVYRHHHVNAFFNHSVALTAMHSKFYLVVGRVKQRGHELVLFSRGGRVVRGVLADVVVVGALYIATVPKLF